VRGRYRITRRFGNACAPGGKGERIKRGGTRRAATSRAALSSRAPGVIQKIVCQSVVARKTRANGRSAAIYTSHIEHEHVPNFDASALCRLRKQISEREREALDPPARDFSFAAVTHAYTPSAWMILPFIVLLAMIALGPILFERWWLKHYPKVAFALAAVTLAYYFFFLPKAARETVSHTAFDYVSFIALVGSLFVVSGGIHINVKGEATPLVNVVFLLVGAVIANFLGTTGASMLMIRPWLRMNKYRVTAHHVVFFIFIVSNVGGCLTPIGDPPLFLGYLKGVPFWWVAEHCWPMWAVAVGFLLTVFYFVDRRNYLKAPARVREKLAEPHDRWRFDGLWNLLFVGVIVAAVFVDEPPFLREGIMLLAAFASWFFTRRDIHEANHFNFHPIREVAVLFVGIFATMMPALDYLQQHAGVLHQAGPGTFYWGSGTLSSVLDNAPTYLSFLKAMFGAFVDGTTIEQVRAAMSAHGASGMPEAAQNTYAALQKYFGATLAAGKITEEQIEVAYLLGNLRFNTFLVAISVGAVFFGANTYIGNGPNFMVKSIADHQKIHTPAFLAYIARFTLPIMLPMLVLVWLLFFRR
jgi:Na+/H+ antiporter NhaD/arsenite permease-like protein